MDTESPIDLPPELMHDPGADLLSTYWPSAIGLVIVAVGVVLTVRAARRRTGRTPRRRVITSSAWAAGTAMVLAVSLALGANTWVGYFPSVPTLARWVDDKLSEPVTEFTKTPVTPNADPSTPLSTESGPRVTTGSRGYSFQAAVPSTADQVADAGAWVYLPPDYDRPGNTDRYPVVYALHGAPGSAADWFAGGRIDHTLDTLINSGHLPPMIVVSPDLNVGPERIDEEPLNRPHGAQTETFVTKDVVAWADAKLRTVPEPAKRMIGGVSSGGLGAVLYGVHSPDVFGGVLSIMPYTTPYTESVIADPRAKSRNTPLEAIAAAPDSKQPFFLGQGDGEPTDEATRIRDALREKGHPATLRVLPDLHHNWIAARRIMPYGLIWVATQMGWNPE